MEEVFSINEFAKLSGIKKDNLRYYDKAGFLKPYYRAENNYRMYGYEQLGSAWLIESLRNMKVPFEVINRYIKNPNTDDGKKLLTEKLNEIEEEIVNLFQLRFLVANFLDDIETSESIATSRYLQVQKESERIHLSEENNDINVNYENLVKFVHSCRKKRMMACYGSVSYLLPKHTIESRRWSGSGKLYIKNPAGSSFTEPGLYVDCYDDYTNLLNGSFFERLFEYLDTNGLSICGNSYAECLLNEITAKNIYDYRIKVSVRVESTHLEK